MADAFLETAMVLSISPDGAVLFASLDGLYILRDRTITQMYVTSERGVNDEYGNLARAMSTIFRIGKEAVVWSPDGHYFTITNRERVVVYANLIDDPTLYDTYTGEIFLIETYPSKLMQGGAAMELAAFTPDGKSLVYQLYGGNLDWPHTLMRYDIEEDKVTMLNNSDLGSDYEKMYVTRDDTVISLYSFTTTPGILTYSHVSGSSSTPVKRDFPVSAMKWNPVFFQYSDKSGYALVNGAYGQVRVTKRIDTKKMYEGMGDVWVLSSLSDGAFVRVGNLDEFPYANDTSLPNITVTRISPDGHYALMAGGNAQDAFAILVHLDDMSFRVLDVPGLDKDALAGINGYRIGADWCMDGTILLAVDGVSKAFRIA